MKLEAMRRAASLLAELPPSDPDYREAMEEAADALPGLLRVCDAYKKSENFHQLALDTTRLRRQLTEQELDNIVSRVEKKLEELLR